MSDSATATKMKKVDNRVRYVIDNAVRQKHRAFVLLVGDEGKSQIVNLHYMLTMARHQTKLNVLWCMKKELAFGGSSKSKRMGQARKEMSTGKVSGNTHESFESFLSHTNIRYCYYKDSHKILGNTFDMLILQDFEALTPNVLARTIETVSGAGIVVLMLRTMTSLKQLYTMSMDVHSRYRSESYQTIVPRFNERFLLSFADCDNFLCVDDSLNVLPITHRLATMSAPTRKESIEGVGSIITPQEKDLMDLRQKLSGSATIGPLLKLSHTLDQAKAVMALVSVISEKTLRSTVAITAGRGRGKSAALGIAVAGAIHQGYSNVFVTAPSPDNLITFFEFVVKTLKELGYVERQDFEIMQSTVPEMKNAVIRINIFKKHRQTVQYVFPQDTQNLSHAELLVIDEAAAIPLPMVQKMFGPYLIFISSTISGYEGTGRSLSLKLISDMKQRGDGAGGRSFKEIELKQPIRYASADPVEKWLHGVLCLESTTESYTPQTTPHPSQCTLYYVNRDALFSYHKSAEEMLQRMMSLLVSAHYKNTPNDLQLLSDAPAHHLYALLGPQSDDASKLPDVYCVIQVCEEGGVKESRVEENLGSGIKPTGDMMPYTLAQQFLDASLAGLKGVRVVRIATHPKMQKCGYGRKALEDFISHCAQSVRDKVARSAVAAASADASSTALGQELAPRREVPTLLKNVTSCPMPAMDYIGVSYGVTTQLLQFWAKSSFRPVYLRQQPNETTGEHSMLMVKPMETTNGPAALEPLLKEFQSRFLALLPSRFRTLPVDLTVTVAMDVPTHNPALFEKLVGTNDDGVATVDGVPQLTPSELPQWLSATDLKRLRAYTSLRVDLGVILDLAPKLALLYFTKRVFRFPNGANGVMLSPPHAAVLLAVGLHGHAFDELTATRLFSSIPIPQLMAFFNKAVQQMTEHVVRLSSGEDVDVRLAEAKEEVQVGPDGRPKRLQVTRTEHVGAKKRKTVL